MEAVSNVRSESTEATTPAARANDAAPSVAFKRTRQPRNSACQPCAALKMRCISSPDGGRCERCQRMNKDCLPSIPKPRKRRVGSESDVESAVHNGPTADQAPLQSLPVATFRPLTTPSIPFHVTSSGDAYGFKGDARDGDGRSFASLFSTGLASVSLPEGMDYNYVKSSLAAFAHFEPHFPFIHSFSGADALEIVRHRPMTTLAICCVTARDTNGWSEHLDHIFRLALAAKAIVDGERSVDLLVGLLVYTAWNHRHHRASRYIYQDLCLLAAMASESDPELSAQRSRNEETASRVERERAILGSYYLCSRLCRRGFHLPHPFRWSQALRSHGENIYRTSKSTSDRSLIALIEFAHTIENLHDDIDTASSSLTHHHSAATAIEAYAKATLQHFKALRREHPLLNSEPTFSAAAIQIYHIQLSANPSTRDVPTLILSACAIKEYLDDILARPASHFHHMSIVDWSDLLEVLVTMSTLGKPLPATSHVGAWESGALSSMLQIDTVLDAIVARLSDGKGEDGVARREGVVKAVREFCVRIKRDAGLEKSGRVNGERHAGSGLGEAVLMQFLRCA